MSSVPGIFVLWEKARVLAGRRILADIRANFEVVCERELSFPCRASEGYRRFYGKALPDEWRKRRTCGDGPFLLVVVRDHSPVFVSPARRSGGPAAWRNRRFVDFKEKYREWAGRHHRVHSTIDDFEFARDVRRLTGHGADEWAAGVPEGAIAPDLPPADPSLVKKSFLGPLSERLSAFLRKLGRRQAISSPSGCRSR